MKYATSLVGGVGLLVGIFWLFAVDAGINGAHWVPKWNGWLAYATCPVVGLVGLNRLANLLVPVLNGLLYGIAAYAVARIWHTGRAHSESSKKSLT